MSSFLSALANLIRSLVWLGVLALLAFGGWVGYETYFSRAHLYQQLREKDDELAESAAKIERLNKEIAAKQRQLEKLDLALRLGKIDRRVAEMFVIEKWDSPPRKKQMTKFQFTEVDAEGRPLAAPKVYTVEGDTVYIDAWVVKYADELVEAGDPLRGASICLFRRVFGEQQEPINGFPLDEAGKRPIAYGQSLEHSAFEKEIWARFWELANNPEQAKKAGIRAAHGEAPYVRVVEGKLYRVVLRSSGGLTIETSDLPKEKAKAL